jgi:hypothetical protein
MEGVILLHNRQLEQLAARTASAMQDLSSRAGAAAILILQRLETLTLKPEVKAKTLVPVK